jgi:competence protein ComEC
MKDLLRLFAAAAAVLTLVVGVSAALGTKPLDIYFIDVEGGQSTLIVTPAGQSLLIDTGYPGLGGRDPDRILAAARDAHVSRIDYLLITHFHEDHDGGAAELARRIPIGTFIDGGSPVETAPEVVAAFTAYEEARRKGQHLEPKPGDRLPLKGIDVEVVTAGGRMLSSPLGGGGESNPACEAFVRRPERPFDENSTSLGVSVRLGAFRFLDLGDLPWNKLGDLACPNNVLGEADAYLVSHHANNDSNVPAFLAGVRPRVAIVNNGAYKGGAVAALATLHATPALDVWQLHRSRNEGAEDFPDTFIANLTQGANDTAAWIKLSASEDGSFTVTNGRTGWTKNYEPPRVP